MSQKLDVGKVFSRIFEMYTSQASVYLPAAVILYLPLAIVTGAVLTGTGGLLLFLLIIALGLVTGFVYQGLVVRSVQDLQDGQRDLSIGELFRSVLPVLGSLILVGIVGGFAEGIGFLLLIVPGVILVTIWAVVAPVIVIENRSFDAFGRSYELTRGNFWQVLAVIVVLFVIQFIIQQIFGAIGGGISNSIVTYAIFTLIGSVIIAPLTALASAVMYFELVGLQGRQPVAGAPVAPGAPGTAPPPPPAAPPPPPPEQPPPPQG
ncbi:MAG TPA: hypothetical protein VGN71_01990 [Solirubrobacteraceae bacterium]|jgi:hypothetical protein|nr:hypothetical protein [Solirubrobacteraceae bacterium]